MIRNIVALVLALIAFAPNAQAQTLTVCVDDYPPAEIHPSETETKKGFAIDLITKVYTDAGYVIELSHSGYQRGLASMADGLCDIMSQIIPGTEPDLITPKVMLNHYRNAYYIRTDDPWTYTGVDSLRERRVADVDGFDYSDMPELQAFMEDENNQIERFIGDDALARALNSIALGRTDMINVNVVIADYLITKNKLVGQLKRADIAEGTPFTDGFALVPGFSKDNQQSRELIDIWDSSFPNLIETGYKAIVFNAYGL